MSYKPEICKACRRGDMNCWYIRYLDDACHCDYFKPGGVSDDDKSPVRAEGLKKTMLRKNKDRFATRQEAEDAFLIEHNAKVIPWKEWAGSIKERYCIWLFEDAEINAAELNWVRPDSSSSESSQAGEGSTKTFNRTKTIYWTNPPCFDRENSNASVVDYDKVAKEAVDAWFKGLKEEIISEKDVKRERMNKDRFDDFDSAWKCFEHECGCTGPDSFKQKAFTAWLFYPYVKGEKRMFSESEIVNKWREKFAKFGYSDNLEDENRKLRKFIEEMFDEFPMFSYVEGEPVVCYGGTLIPLDRKDGSK